MEKMDGTLPCVRYTPYVIRRGGIKSANVIKKIFNNSVNIVDNFFSKLKKKLDILHSYKIIHGDIKEDNIGYKIIHNPYSVEPYIIDFGSTKINSRVFDIDKVKDIFNIDIIYEKYKFLIKN